MIKHKKFWRIALPLMLILLAVYLHFFLNPIPCVINRIFNIYCAGCGASRAVFDIMNFKFLSALGHNALFVISSPFIAYFLIYEYLKLLWDKKIPIFKIGKKGIIAIFIVVILFTVFRNLPYYPFTVLAP